MVDDVVAERLERLVEVLDRRARVAAAERELPEALERAAALARVLGSLERLLEETLGGVEVVEAERELGLREQVLLPAGALVAGREVLAGHAEALPEQLEHLERRRAHARLDPRDVRRRAARKRELPLAQPDLLARFLDADSDRGRVVDMC